MFIVLISLFVKFIIWNINNETSKNLVFMTFFVDILGIIVIFLLFLIPMKSLLLGKRLGEENV